MANGDRRETPPLDPVSKSRLFREFGMRTCLPPLRSRYFTDVSRDCKRTGSAARPTVNPAYHDEMHASVHRSHAGQSHSPPGGSQVHVFVALSGGPTEEEIGLSKGFLR